MVLFRTPLALPWLVLLGLSVLAACDSETEAPPVSNAVRYQIVADEDRSVQEGDFKRSIRRLSIHADAPTIEERVHTVLKSAIDIQEKYGVDYVESYLLISPHPSLVGTGKYVALARFAPDGKDDSQAGVSLDHGTWDVRVTDFTPSAQEARITELWFANRSRFERKGAYGVVQVERPEMQAFIGEELGVPPESVRMNQWQIHRWHPK